MAKRFGLLVMGIVAGASLMAQGSIKHVGAAEFKKLVDGGKGIVLDVRTPGETARGHIKDASMVDYYDPQFKNKLNLMQKNKPIYVYCASGGRSSRAASVLTQLGFSQVYNLQGGIRAWSYAGYPVVTSKQQVDNNIKALSLSEFQGQLKTNVPVLVDFHTQWCVPCKRMAPTVDELEKEMGSKAKVMRIDADQSKETAQHYKVRGVPVFIVFKNGQEVWRHTGVISKEELKKALM
jgi:thioredoxin